MTKKNRYFDLKSQQFILQSQWNKQNVLQRSSQPGLADGLLRTRSVAHIADDKKTRSFVL